MSKVFFFSDMYLPTFPFLEIPLYNEIKSRGIEVEYILQEGDIRLTDPILFSEFSKLNLVSLKNPKDIVKRMGPDDLLLMRFAYKLVGGDVANKVRDSKHNILMYDPSGIDIRVRQCPAQWLTAKSEALKQATLKKFPKYYREVFVTGTIHCDAVATTEVNKEEFMQSYGLDPEKKLIILTPANPGELGHQKGIDDEYAQIAKMVKKRCPGYEIAVKAHPLDYTASMKKQPGIIHKNEHYAGKHSWEKFYPDITVIKAEEGYKAIKACDAVLNVRSSIAMETALFRKPLININRKKYTTNWPFDSKVMMDIEMEDLAYTLNSNTYSVDKKACEEYCKRENYSDDGKAYIRTANIAMEVMK